MRTITAIALFPATVMAGSGPLTLLPQDRGDESAACLDGSPYGIYFVPSTRGSTKWTIYMMGGGWCYNEKDCYKRSQTNLGSSKFFPETLGCSCHNPLEDGRMDNDCNCIFMPYGDGASFAGYRAKPWPVPSNTSQQLYFRGQKNFEATLDFAFAHGLGNATEVVLTGSSAGGLATFLHIDHLGHRLHQEAPARRQIVAAPEVGYFLDHDNIRHDGRNFTSLMKYVYEMQNMTFGAAGLTARCKTAFPTNPHYCFMSPHMQSFIQTPFFMFNSKYDAWQLNHILGEGNFESEEAQAAVVQYGADFLEQFEPVRANEKNGAMISSCICHSCQWNRLTVEDKTAWQHYANWYHGKTSGAAAIHIDTRGPNGDGTMDATLKCVDFPGAAVVV